MFLDLMLLCNAESTYIGLILHNKFNTRHTSNQITPEQELLLERSWMGFEIKEEGYNSYE